jgi:hypothetical protein
MWLRVDENRRFGRTYRLHLHARDNPRARESL